MRASASGNSLPSIQATPWARGLALFASFALRSSCAESTASIVYMIAHSPCVAMRRVWFCREPTAMCRRFRIRTSRGRRAEEGAHFGNVLGMAGVVLVGPRLGIDAGRSRGADSLGDVLWSETPGDDDGDANALDDLAVEVPAMGDAERAKLLVAGPVAVEQEKVGDPIIGFRERDAGAIDDRDRARDADLGEAALERGHVGGRDLFGLAADMEDGRTRFHDDPPDQIHVVREREYRGRSEEHTSELQSPVHLVCRLLLEKKKK